MAKTTDPVLLGQIKERLARRRVRRGAVFLDEHFPGWREHLRQYWPQVCMIEAQHCVLATAGHTRRGFISSGDVMRTYRKGIRDGFAMGFYADEKEGLSYEELESAWEELLFNQPDPPPRVSKPRPSPLQKILQLFRLRPLATT